MPDEELRCPSCRAPQNPAAPGADVKCVFCKTSYRVPLPAVAPALASAVVAPAHAATARSPAGFVAMAVGLMVVVTSLVVFLRFRAPPEPTSGITIPAIGGGVTVPVSDPSAPAVPVLPVAAATEESPTAELVNVLDGTTSIGGRFYLVEMRNTGTVTIGRPAVMASGFDAAGKRVLEQAGFAARGTLPPGESTVILVSISAPPAALDHVDVVPRLNGRSMTDRDVAVVVVESTERSTFGSMHEIVGTARNDAERQVQFIHVVAVGRDADGRPVSYADAFPSNHTLAPGESSGFTLSVGTWEIRRPTRWELVAFGR